MIDWRRVALFAAVGFALGYTVTRGIEATSLPGILALIPGVAGALFLGFALRKLEIPSFFGECGVFAYANYVGIALVRAVGHSNAFARHLGPWMEGRVDGLNLLVLIVGVGYSGFVVGLGIAAHAFFQRLDRPERLVRDDRFLEFLGSSARKIK
jgi:hypothetical protein